MMLNPTAAPAPKAKGALKIRRRKLAELKPNPRNARTHGEANLAAIEASLIQFGQAEPLVVQAGSLMILGGNGRFEVMKKLGHAEVDVVELDLDDRQAAALAVALNRSAEFAEWDDAALSSILSELRDAGCLAGSGYSPAELDQLIRNVEAAAGPKELEDPGEVEPPVVAVARPGDLWLLGEHRLLCGDSTKLADVERVLGGEKAALVATDPPYLVDYTGERPNDSGKDWTGTYREIDIKDAEGFFRAVFSNALAAMAPHAALYVWHAHRRVGLIQRLWEELGILDAQQIIWVKPTAVFGYSHYHYRHEPCIFGWREGSMPPHDGEHAFNSVWEVDFDGKARVVDNKHPTQKPVELFARPMRKHTKPGAIVFEPFSGSGSQLIAAEKEHRRCRAIEITPQYVDAAIERFQLATSRPATLDGDGRTFAEVAKERKP